MNNESSNSAAQESSESPQLARRGCWLRRLHRISGLALLVYMTALFTGTHLPKPEELMPIEGNDKLLHFGAYFGMAILMAIRCSEFRSVSVMTSLAIWSLIALTGAIDEVTQMIPAIHRQADVADWIADLLGGACGLIVWKMCSAVWMRTSGHVCGQSKHDGRVES